MLEHLIIILDDTSISYCHYDNQNVVPSLMPLDVLKKGILFAMKENLNIQYVYPQYQLPKEYEDAMLQMRNCKIKPASTYVDDADVFVIDGFHNLENISEIAQEKSYVFRTNRNDLFTNYKKLLDLIPNGIILNIVLIDIESFTDADFDTYRKILEELSDIVCATLLKGKNTNINILTDRVLLDGMNNCNAGAMSVALAPDGNFYACPAFYFDGKGFSIGNIDSGLDIKDSLLYRLDHSPLCRRCDAFQCKRCVWLNRKLTLEINTPSRQQCVLSHLERNASKGLLDELHKNEILKDVEIPAIDYLDPFDKF